MPSPSSISPSRDQGTSLADAWNTFWFTPANPLPLAMLRIGVGLICLLNFCSYGLSPDAWFAADGLAPIQSAKELLTSADGQLWRHPSLLWWIDSKGILLTVHMVAMGASLAFMLGLFTRISGIVTLGLFLSYIHRAPFAPTHVEPLIAFMLAYLLVGPAGQLFSLDRSFGWGGTKDQLDGEEPSIGANLSLRLIQVHLAMFYGMMALTKLHGDAWWDGEGIWMVMSQTLSRPADWTSLRSNPLVIQLWTHVHVWLELAFPILIWNRHFRTPLLIGTTLLWLLFMQISGLVLFCLLLIIAGLAFLPAESWHKGLSMVGLGDADSAPRSRR